MNKKITFLAVLLTTAMQSMLFGQNVPILIEAESGTLGSDYTTGVDGTVNYVTPSTDFSNAAYPNLAAKVITFDVTFPDTGSYDLYARIRVGAGTFSDDSYFNGNGFGEKNPTTADDWNTVNNIASLGYIVSSDVVDGAGGVGSNEWKWLNISKYSGFAGEVQVTYRVDKAGLDTTFQIGSREDGLDFDKIAFGREGIYYTVQNLNNGEAGSETPILEDTVATPLAAGLDKFLGCAFDDAQYNRFIKYWNQITPGNAGKWGSVEGTRDVMNWTELDKAYNLAKKYNYPFKLHTLLWGAQQPAWIAALDSAEQRAEIEEWFSAIAAHFAGDTIDLIDVVNEPIHNSPSNENADGGNYTRALSADSTANYNWVVEGFRLARKYFPNSKLLLNEYSITNNTSTMQTYIGIVNLLKAEDTLIDGVGIQAHGFSTAGVPVATATANLDLLAATGVPIYISEFDADGGGTDLQQVREYMRIFPMFWEHEAVAGLTMWGFREPTWRELAYLVDYENNERMALIWLREYIKGTYKPLTQITVSAVGDTSAIDSVGGTLQMAAAVLPADATFDDVIWSASPSGIATISATGLLTAVSSGKVTVTASAIDINDPASGSLDVIIDLTSGTNTLFDSHVAIYPNPAENGNFRIDGIDQINQIVIYDLVGKVVEEFSSLSQHSIDIQLNVKSGMYLVQLSDGQNSSYRKIIIK